MLPSEELAILDKKKDFIITQEVANLFAEFIKKSPVDTGQFRSAWDLIQNIDGSWTISNGMEYASVLFDGRRVVSGRWYGSEQWSEGGEIMLKKFNILLEDRLDKLRV